ncbi:hypothetical protein AB8O53_33025, partial [Streptomyces pilosus]
CGGSPGRRPATPSRPGGIPARFVGCPAPEAPTGRPRALSAPAGGHRERLGSAAGVTGVGAVPATVAPHAARARLCPPVSAYRARGAHVTMRVRGVTGVPGGWLYAVGDVNHRALMTHQGTYQARIAGGVSGARAEGRELDDGMWGAHASTADSAVPQVVFTEPEVAAVGLTSQDAERSGRRVRVVDYDIGRVAGAVQYADGYRGRARVLIDADRGTVVGATFVGPGTQELLPRRPTAEGPSSPVPPATGSPVSSRTGVCGTSASCARTPPRPGAGERPRAGAVTR